jgi:hypothetical protein
MMLATSHPTNGTTNLAFSGAYMAAEQARVTLAPADLEGSVQYGCETGQLASACPSTAIRFCWCAAERRCPRSGGIRIDRIVAVKR